MIERVQSLQVRTPEGVAFTFRLASPALRMFALTIDAAVVAAAGSALGAVVAPLNVVSRDVAGLVATLSYFVLSQGYGMATEWLWRGQTLGKRLFRLRVIDARGLRLTFPQIALRNLLRFVDILPAAYLVGGLSALANRRGQRLGDLAAGTVVVWEPIEALTDFVALPNEKYNSLRAYAPAVARLRQSVTPLEARTAWQALVRRDELAPAARVALFAELAAYFRQLTRIPAEIGEGTSDEQFVRNVVDVLFVSRS